MGGKRITVEYITEQFEGESYQLLTKEYVNNKQKLVCICPKEHKHSICWRDWQQGRRCPSCAGNVKLTIEYIREQFNRGGYTLLTAEYKNCRQGLKYKCPEGHEHSISWDNWNKGVRCPYCANVVKLTIEFIRSEFEKENYIFLSKEYINAHQKLEYICPNGHKHSINWTNWSSGQRCYYCFGNVSPTIEFIKIEFAKKECILLSDTYINNHTKLDYICKNGHGHSITWNDWIRGRGCPICKNIKLSLEKFGPNNPNWKNYSEKELKRLFNYKDHVQQLTNHNYRKYVSIINPLNLLRSRDGYHLDHIFSIINGFENSVSAEIISHPFNLRILKAVDNLSKNSRSDISLKELHGRYSNWEKKNGQIQFNS